MQKWTLSEKKSTARDTEFSQIDAVKTAESVWKRSLLKREIGKPAPRLDGQTDRQTDRQKFREIPAILKDIVSRIAQSV
jgi:hypothetical protein